ncbi:RNA demethylase ALKBH9B [Alnus glutinosa]|uniref:RNA demethylase ALKBH9B n=1 Tax=Alnus glutinosa TaxID=3517 RepID=UPI002D773CE9|nr:RNA demethylase ALKBH9B [Alnus glutinosa]
MGDDRRVEPNDTDPFLVKYKPSELRIASEFLTTWLPFLSRDLCDHCAQTLSDRVRSLDSELDANAEPDHPDENLDAPNPDKPGSEQGMNDKHGDDNCEANSLGSWKDGADGGPEPVDPDPSTSGSPSHHRMSWADMAQEEEDDFGGEGEDEEVDSSEIRKRSVDVNASTGELRVSVKAIEKPKPNLSREQREYIRFMDVERKKDFMCFERVGGKLVNILQGLELHKGIFSAAEQKRIVDYVYELEAKGRKRELKERTFTAPTKWMRGKGRVTIQFGCCYNYATDKKGNPPGILHDETVDPMPNLFKVIIRRLVRWHVLPPSCVPDSCIVNIYEEGDCIPPHIDNHDFVRPFCTVSFLSECNILFGSNLKISGPGEFSGSFAIPLPLGSVLVLSGNGADVAKHCVPAVPAKRISITFRRMDDLKRPVGHVAEPDLQGIQPLSYEVDKGRRINASKPERYMKNEPYRRGVNEEARGYAEGSDTYIDRRESTWRGYADQGSDTYMDRRESTWNRRGPPNRWRVRKNVGN